MNCTCKNGRVLLIVALRCIVSQSADGIAAVKRSRMHWHVGECRGRRRYAVSLNKEIGGRWCSHCAYNTARLGSVNKARFKLRWASTLARDRISEGWCWNMSAAVITIENDNESNNRRAKSSKQAQPIQLWRMSMFKVMLTWYFSVVEAGAYEQQQKQSEFQPKREVNSPR